MEKEKEKGGGARRGAGPEDEFERGEEGDMREL
jgi:hypothetical protein